MKKSFLIPYLVWLGFSSGTPIHAVEKSRIAYEALRTSHEVRLTSTVKDAEGLVYYMVALHLVYQVITQWKEYKSH